MFFLYISTSTVPSRSANSIHVMKMCSAIMANDCHVNLIVPDGKEKKEATTSTAYEYYEVKHNFPIHAIRWGRLAQVGYGFKSARIAFKKKADIVYCRNVYAAIFSVFMGLQTVLELHAPPNPRNGLLRYFQSALIQYLFRSKRLAKLVVITYKLKEHIESVWGVSENKILVAPDGADEHAVVNKTTTVGERFKVGYVGQLHAGKGMEVILPLALKCPWADFVVVGGKDEDLIAWKEKASFINNIFFVGYVPHSEVVTYIDQFDVVLLPNQEKVLTYGADQDIGKWTSPLKAFEYMAAGKAIIVSDLPVLKEIFTHEHNALLCRSDDVEDWAAALEKLYDNNNFSKFLGDNAKYDFVQNYTWEARARNIINSLRESV